MKLSEVEECKKYKFMVCVDDAMKKILKSYGFIKGVDVWVKNKSKKVYVVEVLGSKFAINKDLAEIILLAECN